MKKKGVNRREFLRLSAAVGAGAFLVPEATAAVATPEVARQSNAVLNDFPKRTLGRTGVEVPILSMGVMRADNPNLLRASYNMGIFHYDTAHGYQNGRNEEMVGNFFQGKPRETYFVATKVGFGYPLNDNFEEDIEEKLDLSLKRLKMDYVDIFYAHGLKDVDAVLDPRVINELKKLKESGKIRFAGFSTHAHKPEQLDAAIEAGVYDVVLLSYNFKLHNLKETQDAIERAAKAGIGLVAMKTMTGGVEDSEGKKKINAQACLKWVWENPYITTIIPGYTNYDELDECVAAVQNIELSTDERMYLADLCNKEMLFCQQCGACKSQCPQQLPIPDIMRAYMYTYGYKQSGLSKETLLGLNLPQSACADCGTCKVKCPSGFKVDQKIAAITPVMNVPTEFLT